MTTLASISFAEEKQPIEQIRNSVLKDVTTYLQDLYGKEKMAEDIDIRIANLDRRLQLNACKQSLETDIKDNQYGTNSVSVRVRCLDDKRWTIYVPVSIDIYERVAVTTRGMRKGEQISEGDFVLKRTKTSSINRLYLTQEKSILDKELKRPLRPGTVIRPRDLQEPQIVARGDTVMIIAKSGSLTVTSDGTAMASGHLGQQIKILNERSKRIVDGIVSAPGQVTIRI